MDASVDRPRSDGTRRRFARYGYATTAPLATGYAPLSMDYMWRYFHRGGPQIQAAVTAASQGTRGSPRRRATPVLLGGASR